MSAQDVVFTVSLLLNLAFVLGMPIVGFIRFLLKRTKTWVIGIGPTGVDPRLVRPKRDKYVWVEAERAADVIFDRRLMRSTPLGQGVVFVDTSTMHQIAPVGNKSAKETREQLRQLIPYDGVCEDDDNDHVEVILRNREVKVISNVWQRISGWRLNQNRRRDNIDKMNSPDVGMWATLAKLGPIAAIMSVVLILGLFMVVI